MVDVRTRLRAGIAGADITPDRPLAIEGYAHPDGPATGTLDPLEARAIVFDDGTVQAVVIAVDLISLWPGSVDRIRAGVEDQTGIPPDHVMVTYSHTHSGPAATPYIGVTPDADYLHWMEATVVGAVERASQKLQLVTLDVGGGTVDFNVNRRRRAVQGFAGIRPNPFGVVDNRVRVIRVDPANAPPAPGSLDGRALPQADPTAVLFSYACHPTVLGAQNYRYSGDYPGAARRFVERAYAASPNAAPLALFLPGCFGNIRPHLLAPDGRFRPGTDHELTVLGRWLGSEVIQVAERTAGESVDSIGVARRSVEFPYERVANQSEIRAALDGPRRYWAEFLLERIAREGQLPPVETSEVQVLRLGRHWLVATPGETVLEIGLSIERGFAELGLVRPERGDQVITIGYANDYVAYLCSASVMVEGGYEADSWQEYLRSGPFVPEVESILVNTALEMATELAKAR